VWHTVYRRTPENSTPIRRWRSAVLTGLALGLSAYTYTAWPVLFATIAGFIVALAIFDRATFRLRWRDLLVIGGLGTLIALPMISTLLSNAQVRQALNSIADPVQQMQAGNLGRVLFNMRVLAEVPFYIGDPSWRYNVADRPIFGTIFGLFVYGGIVVVLWQLRRKPINALLLGLLIFGGLPSLITRDAPSFTRAVLMFPALILLVAIAIDAIGRLDRGKGYRRFGWTLGILAIAVTASVDWPAYYVFWARTDEVRAIYRDDVRLLGKFLSNQHESTVYVISDNPDDAAIYRYSKPQSDPTNVIWLDGKSPLVLSDKPTLLFITPGVALSAEIKGALATGKGTQFLGPANAPDGKRMFDLYRLPAR
jgi:hypothetical protein